MVLDRGNNTEQTRSDANAGTQPNFQVDLADSKTRSIFNRQIKVAHADHSDTEKTSEADGKPTEQMIPKATAVNGARDQQKATELNSLTERPTSPEVPKSKESVNIHRLPDGDRQLETTGPKVGKVFVSKETYDRMMKGQTGATGEGPWLNRNKDGTLDGTYDLTKKIAVEGNIQLKNSKYHRYVNLKDDTVTITGNTLPSTEIGKFPLDRKYYSIDRNPNRVEPNDFSVTVPRYPTPAENPSPIGLGAIAILKNGSLSYGPNDGQGNDAVKRELQDKNNGHPSESQHYHVHNIPPILYEKQDSREPVGTAIDGYKIVAARKSDGQLYSTKELDEFHGRVVDVKQDDGTVKKEWAYCVSLDYPYTIGAFKGTPAKIEGLKEVGLGQGPNGGMPGDGNQHNHDGKPDRDPKSKASEHLPSLEFIDDKNSKGSFKSAKLETTLFDIAQNSLLEKRESIADSQQKLNIRSDDVYRELNRIMILNGYQPANLNGRHNITDRN